MNRENTTDCDHKPAWVGRIAVSACAECASITWMSEKGSVDHAEAMTALFGSFDLVGQLDALGAPSPKVLVYSPPRRQLRRHFDVIPARVWLKAGPHLWLSHDGEHLLLATNHALLFDNMTRGA